VSQNCGIKDGAHIGDKFINIAVDEKVLEVETSHSLSPCTKEFAHVRCTLEDSRQLVFVDTPAFPHPLSAKKEVGEEISEWLKEAP
jgi:hypothetical protein